MGEFSKMWYVFAYTSDQKQDAFCTIIKDMEDLMGIEIYLIALVFLMLCAVMDLIVGVSNDAVNFLNSSFGSKVAPYWLILIIASIGILAGVTFSSGMMEVARKGIFHPGLFTMPELITIFFAVMLTDIILLDLFNTFGMPTSTTVSIVFELLGAAVGISLVKIMIANNSELHIADYINTAKALMIITGILLSVIISFIGGCIAQFLTRIIFTFDYMERIRRYGAVWGGIAMACISYFILVKGAKGTTFLNSEAQAWIMDHTLIIIVLFFIASSIIFQILIIFFRTNIFKPIILVGTYALAMAFAANDLVNFIGVPMAGFHAYKAAIASGDPLHTTMEVLNTKVSSETFLLLLAGIIMVVTLWFSRKARTVTQTELSLGQQGERLERFESIFLSQVIVRIVIHFAEIFKQIIPDRIIQTIAKRTDPSNAQVKYSDKDRPSFDLVRASVNLMMASIVISYATSVKLPLSTTYVTFMVAMGTSFADRAWGRESAVYRVTGVLAVIGGWFMTAFIAFTVSFIFANILFYFKVVGAIFLIVLVIWTIRKTSQVHSEILKTSEDTKIIHIEKVTDVQKSLNDTFINIASLLNELRISINDTFIALFTADLIQLRREKRKVKQVQTWVNIIIANVFKVLRSMQHEKLGEYYNYAHTIRRLQKLSDAYRDIVLRCYIHISNNHKGLHQEQKEEILEVKNLLVELLKEVEEVFLSEKGMASEDLIRKNQTLNELIDNLDKRQVERIQQPDSKTRLSIMYYAIIGNCIVISRQNIKLLEVFNQCFSPVKREGSHL